MRLRRNHAPACRGKAGHDGARDARVRFEGRRQSVRRIRTQARRRHQVRPAAVELPTKRKFYPNYAVASIIMKTAIDILAFAIILFYTNLFTSEENDERKLPFAPIPNRSRSGDIGRHIQQQAAHVRSYGDRNRNSSRRTELIRRLASSSEKQKSITALFDRKESIEQFEELCKDICAERDGLRLACFTFANASAEKGAALRESDFILCYYGNISPSDAYKENKVFQKMQNPRPTAA